MEAKLDRSGFFTFDKKKKHFITVNSVLDLNQTPGACQPVRLENSKTFGCLCCTSAPLSAMVSLPRTGYVAGENISVTSEIENGSDKTMSCSKAKLIQCIVFRSYCGRTKQFKRTLQVIIHLNERGWSKFAQFAQS